MYVSWYMYLWVVAAWKFSILREITPFSEILSHMDMYI